MPAVLFPLNKNNITGTIPKVFYQIVNVVSLNAEIVHMPAIRFGV